MGWTMRSLSLLHRMNAMRMTPITHRSLVKPQYIAIRTYFNPDADHGELSETAWKEKRLYRYYKFTNNLTVSQQGRGYAQGIFMIGMFCVTYLVLGIIDYETCVQYRHWRLWRKNELKPWLNDAYKNGYMNPYNYSKANGIKYLKLNCQKLKKCMIRRHILSDH